MKDPLTWESFHYIYCFQRMLKVGATVKVTDRNLVPKIEMALRESLAKVPALKVRKAKPYPAQAADRPDLAFTVSGKGFEKTLLVEAKAFGQPRMVREAANAFARYALVLPKSYPVFAAPYISPKAAEICDANEMGYIDLAGNCCLKFGAVYIERGGNTNPFSEKRELRTLFSPKASRVLRVLLLKPDRAWKLQDLAKEAEVSLGQVANVKRLLATREWVREGGSGLSLSSPESLLSEWSRNYSYRKNTPRDFFSLLALPDLEASLAKACKKKGWRYAFTGFSGAARLAPAVRYSRAMAYFDGDIQCLSEELKLKEVPSGPNLTLLAPYDDGVFYAAAEQDGVCLASPIQIYLDLAGFRGRGEEAAEAILREVIKTTW